LNDLVRRIYGPPGTGKTRALTDMAIQAAARFGPERVAALTYTRAAATELKERIARALGVDLPEDSYARARKLGVYLPWVGTIHSLAYKLADRPPVLRQADLRQFVAAQGGHSDVPYPTEVDHVEGYEWLEAGRDEVEQALALWAVARHRCLPLDAAFGVMAWGPEGPQVSPERASRLVAEYAAFKHSLGKIDFEDMLVLGLQATPPVDVLLADEVQDLSPLLWQVQDTWAHGLLYVMAGDPYQALYIWSGAEPRLFIEHPGKLVPLGHSHRLTAPSADRAQGVLRAAGAADPEWLGTWTGIGAGEPRDGTTFWLARTGRLVAAVARRLEDQGVPFGHLRGPGPLEQKPAQAYRVLAQLRLRGAAPLEAVSALAQELERGWLAHGAKARLKALHAADPEAYWDVTEVRHEFGGRDPDWLASLHHGLQHGEYYERVYRAHGLRPFTERPSTLLGTIHAAKGREADVVHLVESWGSLPYRAIYNGQHAAEACVAYVGLTRHRAQLVLEPADDGTPYPF
jgi:superfamily I DNA/RNA helicase